MLSRAIPFVVFFSIALFSCDHSSPDKNQNHTSYYLNNSGNDSNAGSKASPWKSLSKLNATSFQPGDTVYLEGGQIFNGSIIIDSGDSGNLVDPVVITTHGSTPAIVNAGNNSAISLSSTKHVTLKNLHIKGSGRKDGNTASGFEISNCENVVIENLETEGFQKSGLLIYSSKNVTANNVFAHENGATGILITGESSKNDSHNVLLRNSKAENNPGDPTNKKNHSGNGILVGYSTRVLIEYCVATNNGWDMPRVGNGPVGIWAYESDSVTIQHCISYQNKTSKGGEDGGGFDLDGGVTNSIIQYCLSWQNQGSGFGLFQYSGATKWNNNTIRYNISENDGLISAAKAGIYIWNGTHIKEDFTNCFIYNNVIYNDEQAAIAYSPDNGRQNFFFYNNILVGKADIIRGLRDKDVFLGNNWRSLDKGFYVDGLTDIAAWSDKFGQEKLNGVLAGMSIDPQFVLPGATVLTDPLQLNNFGAYEIPASSALRSGGADLKNNFAIDTGGKDLQGNGAPATGVGAIF